MTRESQDARGFRGFQRFQPETRPEASQQLAVFTLGELEYAIDIMRIRQIIRPLAIRPVPYAPDFVDGVIELRGSVIPVVDLRRRFGLEPGADVRAVKFFIVRLRGRQLGLVVDSVVGVLRVRLEEIRPTPQWITGPEAAVFNGVCRREDRLVLLLDLERLLSTREALSLGDVVARKPSSERAVPDAGARRLASTPLPRAAPTPAPLAAPTPAPLAAPTPAPLEDDADGDDDEDWDSVLGSKRESDD